MVVQFLCSAATANNASVPHLSDTNFNNKVCRSKMLRKTALHVRPTIFHPGLMVLSIERTYLIMA